MTESKKTYRKVFGVFPASSRGFTLMEVLVASVIVGIGFTAILASMVSSTKVNLTSTEITQAAFLSQEIREWTANLPFRDLDSDDAGNPPGPDSYVGEGVPYVDDLDDLINVTFSPPRNSSGETIAGMADWSQTIILTWRLPGDVNTEAVAGTSNVIHVQVTVSKDNETLMQTGWLIPEEGGIE